MNTISLRMNDDETKLLRDYVSVNNLNLSLDEERILKAHEKAKHEKKYDHTEVWKMLGI